MLWFGASLLVSSTFPELRVLLSLRFSIPRETPAFGAPVSRIATADHSFNRTRLYGAFYLANAIFCLVFYAVEPKQGSFSQFCMRRAIRLPGRDDRRLRQPADHALTVPDVARLSALVTGLAFALAFVFGAVANRVSFCTMGAITDIVNFGDWGRVRM